MSFSQGSIQLNQKKQSAAAGITGAENGLTVVGANVRLGGANALLANTTLLMGGFTFDIKNGTAKQLNIDPTTFLYTIGDLAPGSGGTNLQIDGSANKAIIFRSGGESGINFLDFNNSSRQYQYGDLSGAGNASTAIVIDSQRQFYFSAANKKFINLDGGNNIYKIGDIDTKNNGTFITIDDQNIGATLSKGFLMIGTAGSSIGSIKLCGNTSGTVTLQPASAAGTWTLTIPTATPGANGYALTANTSGVTSWTNPSSFTPAITSGQIPFGDVSNLMTSSAGLSWANNLYPVLYVGGAGYNEAAIAVKDLAGTYGSISGSSGLTLTGSTTYKNIYFNDYSGGLGTLLTMGSSSGSMLAQFNALVSTSATTILSNYVGCFNINRTFSYSAPGGNNPHGYTDNTVCRLGGGGVAFNSFSSFVTFGNTAGQNLGHFASFQSVWTKDQSNTADIVYDFVAAVSSITGGTITNRYGFYLYDATASGGGAITTQTGIYIPALSVATNNYGIVSLTTKNGFGTASPTMMLQVAAGRFGKAKGADVASANDLTLGSDGNLFHITGATTINAITTANWQSGSEITLIFDSTPTVKNNTAGGAGTAKMLLAGAADFSATANDVLKLCYDGTSWFEVCRSVN